MRKGWERMEKIQHEGTLNVQRLVDAMAKIHSRRLGIEAEYIVAPIENYEGDLSEIETGDDVA